MKKKKTLIIRFDNISPADSMIWNEPSGSDA